MTQHQELADRELIRRFRQGHKELFDELYERHDPPLLRELVRRLHSSKDPAGLARGMADWVWAKIYSHPDYLRGHRTRDRPLAAFLADLAYHEAEKQLGRQARRIRELPLGDRQILDPWDSDKQTGELWQQVMDALSAEDAAFLRADIDRSTRRSAQEQIHYNRLVRNLRRHLVLD
jgi:hypothetical protein